MKDRFDEELRIIMEEESKGIFMRDELKDNILKSCKMSFLGRIRGILNSYIEIPIPVVLGAFVLIIVINLISALNIDIDIVHREIIKIGDSQVIVREIKDVNGNED